MPLIAARPPAGAATRLNAGGSGYTLPAVPVVTGLAVNGASGASWTAVEHPTVTGYEIAAGASPAPTTIVASPSGKLTTSADLGLTAGSYFVRIRAVSPAETGAWSADVSVTVVDQIAIETAGTLSQEGVNGTDQSIGNFTVDADADQLLIFLANGCGVSLSHVTGVKYDGVAATLVEQIVEPSEVAASVWVIEGPTLSTSAAVQVTTTEATDVVAGLVPISLGNATVLVGAKAENSWAPAATLTRTVAITTQQANSAVFVMHAESDGAADVTPESGQTEVVESNTTNYNLEVSWKLSPVAGADTVGATSTTVQGKALIAIEVINTSESVAAPDPAAVLTNQVRVSPDAYGTSASGGESTTFDFRVEVDPNDDTVIGVEVRDGISVVATLVDQGSNIWALSTQLAPNVYEDLVAWVLVEGAEYNGADLIDVSVYATPTITTHADEDTNVPLTDTVAWIPAGGADYDFQVATDSGFSSLVQNVAGHGTASIALAGLSGSTTYYMRVRDTDSDWSDTIQFTTAAGAPAAVSHRWAVGENDGGSLVLALDSDFNLALGLIGIKIKTGTLDTSGIAVWDMGYNAGAHTGAKLEINASKQLALTWGDGSASWTVTGGTALADATEYCVHIYRGSGSTSWTIELDNAAETQSGDTGSKGYSATTSGNFVVLGDSPNISVNNLIVFTGYASTGDASYDGENFDAWPTSESVEYFASRRSATELVKAGFGESSTTGAATTRANAGTKGNFTDTQGTSNYVASSDIAWVPRWATGNATEDPRLTTPGANQSGMDFSTDSIACCILVRPFNLLGSGDRVLLSWGFDETSDEGWELQLTSTNLLRLRVNGVNINHAVLANDTTYEVTVYHVAGTVYLRVNGSEIGNSATGVQASTANTEVAVLNSVDDVTRGSNSYEKNMLVLSGGYSGTEATALTEIRADIAAFEAFVPADNFYDDVSGASFTGGLEIVAAFDESAVATRRNVRVDRSGNSRYFEDRYDSFPPSTNAWVPSTDNDSV